MNKCPNCKDLKWVCENHPGRPWAGIDDVEGSCECGAGQPCAVCNQQAENPLGFKIKLDTEGWRN